MSLAESRRRLCRLLEVIGTPCFCFLASQDAPYFRCGQACYTRRRTSTYDARADHNALILTFARATCVARTRFAYLPHSTGHRHYAVAEPIPPGRRLLADADCTSAKKMFTRRCAGGASCHAPG